MIDRHMSESLDRYITGNYGEDQFRGMKECPICGFMIEKEEITKEGCLKCLGDKK